eukprot:m.124131 g.124131  ORF g.124131 m.124131 type:complete len:140 (-) comp22061_c0_seq2:385-804(-)
MGVVAPPPLANLLVVVVGVLVLVLVCDALTHPLACVGYAWLYVAFSIRRRMLLGEQNQYALLEEGNAAEESVEAIPPPYDEARARQPLLGEGGAEAAPPSYGSLSPVPPALAAELSPQDSLHEPPKEELPDYSAPGTPS